MRPSCSISRSPDACPPVHTKIPGRTPAPEVERPRPPPKRPPNRPLSLTVPRLRGTQSKQATRHCSFCWIKWSKKQAHVCARRNSLIRKQAILSATLPTHPNAEQAPRGLCLGATHLPISLSYHGPRTFPSVKEENLTVAATDSSDVSAGPRLGYLLYLLTHELQLTGLILFFFKKKKSWLMSCSGR